jgi:hypothetical protein
MARIFRQVPKNAVVHWRAVALHPACATRAMLEPDLIAGPYMLLADMTAHHRRDTRPS